MKPFEYVTLALFLAISFEVSLSAEMEVQDYAVWPKILRIDPKPHGYRMKIQEFHECVSCSDDEKAREDFDNCLRGLSPQNQKIVDMCCKNYFEGDFCKNASSGKTDYKTICKDPRKGLEVERCFWKKLENKKTLDVEQFRECKKQILSRYCTTKNDFYL